MKNILFWLSRKINYPLVSPQVLQISLTYRCNLRCKMCSIANLLPVEEELSTRQLYSIIDEAANFGIKEILLTGGEPFLRDDIFELSRYIHQKGMRSIITTNALLIDEACAKKIAQSQISHIHISIDGLKETNDFLRGPGTFEKIKDALKYLNQARKNIGFFSLGFACTVMDKNVQELSALVQFADEEGVDVINFQPLVKDNANFLNKTLPLFWLDYKDIPVLANQIEKIKNTIYKHITVYEEPALNLIVKYYKGDLKRRDWVCFGGFKTVFVCFSKKQPLVYSCHGVCGNLDNLSLKRAWRSKEAYKLRLHSGGCRNLCLQSCYSLEAAGNINNLINYNFRKGKSG